MSDTKPIKIGWLGDTHLGYRQYGLQRRSDDFRVAFEDAVKQMIAAKVSCIVHTGDIVHVNRPGPETVHELREIGQLLQDHGLTMYCISGNHELASRSWVGVAQMMLKESIGGFQVIDGKTVEHRGIRIHGVPALGSKEQIMSHLDSIKGEKFDMVLMHVLLAELMPIYIPEAMLRSEDLPANARVVAIGDLHLTEINTRLMEDGSRQLYGYAGSTEMNARNEPTDKYWIELDFTPDGVSHKKHKIKTRPVVKYTIKSEQELQNALVDLSVKASSLGDREPMVIVDYMSNVEGVASMFQEKFDPGKFVFSWKPVMHADSMKSAAAGDLGDLDEPIDIPVEAILESEANGNERVIRIVRPLLDPDVDHTVTIPELVDKELKTIETPASPAA